MNRSAAYCGGTSLMISDARRDTLEAAPRRAAIPTESTKERRNARYLNMLNSLLLDLGH
jgi:hypothetical protein